MTSDIFARKKTAPRLFFECRSTLHNPLLTTLPGHILTLTNAILSVSFESYRFAYLIELSCNFDEIEQILFRKK